MLSISPICVANYITKDGVKTNLGFRKLHHIVADIVQECQGVDTQSCVFSSPDLVEELSKFQNSARSVHRYQHVAIPAKCLQDIC